MLELEREYLPGQRRDLDRFPQAMPTPTVPPRRFGVLVVDDEKTIRHLLWIGLHYHGLGVYLAASGTEALEKYAQHSSAIQVALLDIQMPGMSGPETLADLRILSPQVRCCFMSGYATHYTPEQLHEMGVSSFVRKPFRLATVAQMLLELAAKSMKIGSPAELVRLTAYA